MSDLESDIMELIEEEKNHYNVEDDAWTSLTYVKERIQELMNNE